MRIAGEPRFKPGDQVRIRGGLGRGWTVVRIEPDRRFGISYLVANGKRKRTVDEAVLIPWSEQVPA